MPELHHITEIWLNRAEGEPHHCGQRTFDTWLAANRQLWDWSRTAPKDGSYHKCDVRITWDDDSIVTMRYDLEHHSVREPNLMEEVRSSLQFWAGRKKFFDEQSESAVKYRCYVESMTTATQRESCIRLLEEYQIG